MATATISATIDRPVSEVWAYVTDPGHAPEWQSTALEIKRETTGPVSVGTTWIEVRKFLGKHFEQTMKVTELDPERTFTVKSESGPIPVEARNTFTQAGAGTRLQVDFEGESRGFFKLAEPIVVRVAERQFQGDIETLKDLLEARTAAPV